MKKLIIELVIIGGFIAFGIFKEQYVSIVLAGYAIGNSIVLIKREKLISAQRRLIKSQEELIETMLESNRKHSKLIKELRIRVENFINSI
jgi:hypothetical protein